MQSWFGKDDSGDIYIKNDENGRARGFYTYSFLSAGGKSSGSGESGSSYTQWEWGDIKYLQQSETGALASAYSVKEVYTELNTVINALASSATKVSFAPNLTGGKAIGTLTIDGVGTTLYAPQNYAWGDITGKPTTIAGYGITDALTTANYNAYAPTLTGKGASGTWGINISGNATTATKLQTARTIWGQSFDGTGNVSGALTGVTDITASGNATIAGNVGIGTTSPLYALDIKGTARATEFRYDGPQNRYTKYGQSISMFMPTAGGWAGGLSWNTNDGKSNLFELGYYYGAGVNSDLFYFGYGASYVKPVNVILPNGNIGIGTKSPSGKIHIIGQTSEYPVYISKSGIGTHSGDMISLSQPNSWCAISYTGASGVLWSVGASADSNGTFHFWNNYKNANAAKLDKNGNFLATTLEASTSIKIGNATISWDSKYGCLKVDKGLYSTDFLSSGGKSDAGGTGGGTVTGIKIGAGDIITPIDGILNIPPYPTTTSLGLKNLAFKDSLAVSEVVGLQSALDGKQAVISDLATIRNNAANGNTAYSYFTNGKLPYTSVSGTPDLSDMATKTWVNVQGYLTGITSSMVTSALGSTYVQNANYATRTESANKINSRGSLTVYTEGSMVKGESGLNLYGVYENGYPAYYGNLLHINGGGAGQLLAEWCGNSNLGRLYYRSKRDNDLNGWSAWGTVAWTSDIPTNNNQLTNGAGYITSSGSCAYATSAGSAPASDVYAWAKASTKPSYSFSEITSKPTTISGYGITDALTTSNYNSYAPKLDGTGASGTWGINISGNAESATKLQTARTIWGHNFDGTGDVGGALTGVTDITASGYVRDAGLGYISNSIGGIGWHTVAHLSDFHETADIYISNAYVYHPTQGLHIRIANGVIEVLSSNITTITKVRFVDKDVDVYYSVENFDTFYWRVIGNGCGNADGSISTKTGGNECVVNMGVSVNSNLTASGNATIAGNVLIGTTSDYGGKLQVDGYLRFVEHGVHLAANGSNGNWANTAIISSGWEGGIEDFTEINVSASGANTASIRLIKNGNVGIGTTSPFEKLHVIGNILATGEVTAGQASDARLKSNIVTARNACGILRSLRGVEFDWNAIATENCKDLIGHDVGLIAQEVESLIPSAIGTIWDEYKRLDYTKITPYLVEGWKEHDDEIQRLKTKIKQLEERIYGLEKQ